MGKKIHVAFDLGNNSLKIAVGKKDGLLFHQLQLPEHLVEDDAVTMPHAFSTFLKKAKRELGLPSGPAGLILPGSQVICRLVTMPKMTVEQLMLNLPYEFSDFIHGEPHQYYCDYALCQPPATPVGEGEDAPEELTMMAAAVERQRVQEYGRMFAAGGFSLKLMLPQEMALIQLVKSARRRHPDAPEDFCFLDFGYLATRIYVVQGDRIQATRRIPTGGRELAKTAAELLNIEPFLADSYLRTNHKDIQEHPGCVELYEHIAVETLKLINFYHFTYRQNQLNGVYLIGGGAGIGKLRQVLEDTLDLPALPMDDLLSGSGDASACACAAGLMVDLDEEE